MTGNVYFVQEDHSGPIKIGFTKGHVHGRSNSLQAGNPRRLQVLGWITGCSKQDEKSWHDKYAAVRLVGEWFAPTVELQQDIISSINNPRYGEKTAPYELKALSKHRVDCLGWVQPEVRKAFERSEPTQ